jgi:DNA-binding response OmpR family regulator
MSATAKKGYVLIAEDDVFYARLYEIKLKKEGLDVVVVGNGALAMDEARRRVPALILLDLIMPVQDGFETLRRLKDDKVLSKVRTIVFSNLGQDEDRKKARELGADDYFVKAEISVQEMVAMVRRYVA